VLIIDVPTGAEVLETATKRLAEEGISTGVIVSIVGAVDRCRISTMPRDDASKDIIRDYAEPFEMLGNGEVREGVPHVHCTVGREDGLALAGHRHSAHVGHWFVRLYVIPST